MKRFKFPLGFGGQDKVTFGQTLNLVRPYLELALPPGQIQIRMVALSLRNPANFVRKGLRLGEVLEMIEPFQMPLPVNSPALAEVFNSSLARRAFNGGTPPSSLHFLSPNFIVTSLDRH